MVVFWEPTKPMMMNLPAEQMPAGSDAFLCVSELELKARPTQSRPALSLWLKRFRVCGGAPQLNYFGFSVHVTPFVMTKVGEIRKLRGCQVASWFSMEADT